MYLHWLLGMETYEFPLDWPKVAGSMRSAKQRNELSAILETILLRRKKSSREKQLITTTDFHICPPLLWMSCLISWKHEMVRIQTILIYPHLFALSDAAKGDRVCIENSWNAMHKWQMINKLCLDYGISSHIIWCSRKSHMLWTSLQRTF